MTYLNVIEIKNKKCATCGMPMHESAWTDGSSGDTQPRSIHGLHRNFLLVSAIYTCDAHHRTLAHDDSILKLFPTQDLIPFVLFYRSGFTQELASMCVTLISTGMTIFEIESLVTQKRWETHAREQRLKSLHALTTHKETVLHNEFMDSYLCNTPSNDLITKCFLAMFAHNEYLYIREMFSLNVGSSITWDHTFNVATNIGYLREDNVWVPVYDSLFIIMNSQGQVVSWQLTKGTGFAQIEHSLHTLFVRSQQQNCPVTTVYVDDCCKLRNKIRSVFGQETTIKLDIFHAVQRLTNTISKKNDQFQKCVRDLRLVFRQDGDSEYTRMCTTPSPDVMNRKMEAFLMKWRDVRSSDNKLVLNSDTISAINNLKRHITRGCLSNIPPGFGTNRNEKFHSFINSKLHRSRIGVFLAYALFTVFLYAHNASIKVHRKVIVRPITAAPLRYLTDNVPLPSFGIAHKLRDQQQQSTNMEIDISENCLDLHSVRSIYSTSLYKYYLLKSIESMHLGHIKEAVVDFKPFMCGNKDKSDHAGTPVCSDVNSRLSDYGLQRIEVLKDGNCFFMSVATIISRNRELGQVLCSERGPSMQLEDTFTLSKHLRRLFVDELLSDRCDYKAFLVDDIQTIWEDEVKKFASVGHFDSVVGDLMPYAISNILGINIVIIPTDCHTPVMYVNPTEVSNKGIIFLVYTPHTQECPGHYDAAEPVNKVTVKENKKRSSCCSCGVNSTVAGRKSCITQPHYASRCACYKSSTACGLACRCKHCANPHRIRPEKAGKKHTRRPHNMQIEVPSAKRFVQEKGGTIPTSIWSDFETIVLSVVRDNVSSEEVSKIVKQYNDIVYYSTAIFCYKPLPHDFVFRQKDEVQVKAKLVYMKK